jgi:protein required for attachment to host cells
MTLMDNFSATGVTVFVADSRQAKIFELSEPGALPRSLETIDNPFTARHDRDLGTDAPGTVMARSGQHGSGAGMRRTALQPRRSHKQHAVSQFARQLADRVTTAANNHDGGGVILVAAPRFLAELRGHLPKSTLQRVVRELPRDLVGLSAPALQRRLAEALRL